MDKYGFVLFDDPSKKFVEAKGGWACVHGDVPHRIRSGSDLASSVRWVSNLEDVKADPRHVKRSDYLFHSNGFKKVSNLLALNPLRGDVPESAVAMHLAHLTHNVERRFELAYGKSIGFFFSFFSDEIRALTLPADELGCYEAEVLLALADATVTRSSNNALREKAQQIFGKSNDHVLLEFRFNPVSYIQKLMGLMVPEDCQPQYLGLEQLPDRPQRLEWALSSERPVLAKVSVSHLREKYAGILNFQKLRSVAGRQASQMRAWMTQPELALYAEFARIDIDGAYVFGSYAHLNALTLSPFPFFNDVDFLSPSSAVLALNHFVALSRPQRAEIGMRGQHFRKHQSKYTGRSISDLVAMSVPRCAWMNAYDRRESFKAAQWFTDHGFLVAHYSLGTIHVAVAKDRDSIDEAILCGKEIGLAVDSTAFHLMREMAVAQAA